MNRHDRRALARETHKMILLDQIDLRTDIQVDAKVGQIVMVLANAKGRKVVEDLWPDVEWTTDEIFSSLHSPDWLFTHIRVTKLPLHLEEKTPLAFASPDQLGLAVAMALQRLAGPARVAFYSGQNDGLRLNFLNRAVPANDRDFARSLFAEHVPAGTPVRTLGTGNYITQNAPH
jgi:hypothetical protein